MTPLFITGGASLPQQLLSVLQAHGLPAAQPLPRDTKITLDVWHDKVATQGQQVPGPAWQQLAAELLLANMEQPVWAWAAESALPMLDFWAGYEATIRFVLLAETPAQALLRSTEALEPDNKPDTQAVLQHWLATHQQLLRFALRHPQRCTLVWASQAMLDPSQLARTISGQWQLAWHPTAASATSKPNSSPLAEHLAQHATMGYPLVQELFQELQTCVTPLQGHAPALVDPLQLLGQYRALQAQANISKQLPELHTQLAQLQAQQQASLQQLEQVQTARAQTQTQLQDSQAQLHKQTTDKQQLQQQLEQTRTHLQQSQSDQQKTIKQLEETKQSLQAAQSSAARVPELQKQLDATKQQLQVSTEKATQQAAQQAQQIKTLTEQTLQLQKSLETQAQHKEHAQQQQWQEQLQAQTQKLRQNEQQLSELQVENDQLLAQLHETQEELESYCIQNEELQKQITLLGALQRRWYRLFETHRELYAVESVGIDPVPLQSQQFQVKLTGLHMAGRHFDTLELGLAIDPQGCAIFSLVRPQEG